MSKTKDNVNSLLAAIKRQTPVSQKAAEPEPHQAPQSVPEKSVKGRARRAVADEKPKGRIGKPVQFWMHDEDRKLIRELSAWLAGQGTRPSDSMVIRAALRLARTGNGLLEAYWQAAKLDGRLKRE